MKYIYKNITFNFTEEDVAYYSGNLNKGESDGIGWTMLDIPSKHVVRMKRDGYYIEEEYNNRIYRILPHTKISTYKNEPYSSTSVNSDITDSTNTDLHIVYFKWMLSHSRKKFEIDISCDNPYWIFHDIAHEDDVQGVEVCCLSKRREENVLENGLELMIESGYIPSFSAEYYEKIRESFYNRWQQNLDHSIFEKYVEPEYEEDYED